MDRIDQGTISCGIPAKMVHALRRYLEHGELPGAFLCAIISNNLRDAVMQADDHNRFLLPNYVQFFCTYAPSTCWGSSEAMYSWSVARLRETQDTSC